MAGKPQPLEKRFWPKVDKAPGHGPRGDCWLWTGCKHADGYGEMRVAGKRVFMHRLSYQFANGEVPAGLLICHTCDVRNCVNPAHLFADTNTANMQDMVAKKRHCGQKKTHCKQGHLYTPETTGLYRGHRYCRICNRAGVRQRRLQKLTAKQSND